MSRPLETRSRPPSEWVQKRAITYEEFLGWADEDTLAEWVDGVVVMTSPASARHQEIANFLVAIFSAFAELHSLGKILNGPFQMKLARSGREPDVLFIAKEHLARLKRTYLDGPADLVVEIISPESEERDRSSKFYEYQDAGVSEYWLIDPELEQTSFYQLDDTGHYQQVAPDEMGRYRSRALPGFWLRLAWLWQDPLPSPIQALLEIDYDTYSRYLQEHLHRAAPVVPSSRSPIGTLLINLKGHTNEVWGVAWSPDGERLASASHDQTVRVWNATSGKLLATLSGHTDKVNSVAWSPDGGRLASSGNDTTVRVWEVASGRELATFKGHIRHVYSVAWSPDGQCLALASGGEDKDQRADRVYVRDAASGLALATFSSHTDSVWSVAWSPDGQRLASAGFDRRVRLWDIASGRQLIELFDHSGEVYSVAWSPDGQRLASGRNDRLVKVWNATSGKLLATLSGHTYVVYSVAWSPDGQRLISASGDHTVRLWDAASGQCLFVYQGHTGPVRSVAWSPDGSRLASASEDMTVQVWSAG